MEKHPENTGTTARREQPEDTGTAKKTEPAAPERKKEMQDPLTRQDPNCEGEFWDTTEDQEKAVAPGKKDDL